MKISSLQDLIKSDSFTLLEKVTILHSQCSHLEMGKRTAAEDALRTEIQKHDFSIYGNTKDILACCSRIFTVDKSAIFEVHKAAAPFMDMKTLTLNELLAQIAKWQYFGSNILTSLFAAQDWKKIDKSRLLEALVSNSSKAIWSFLIDGNFIKQAELQKILFGQNGFSTKQVEAMDVYFRDELVNCHGLPEALLSSDKLPFGYKLAALRMIHKKGMSDMSIFSACEQLINSEKNENNIVKIGKNFGYHYNEYGGTVLDIAINKLNQPKHLLKLARRSSNPHDWETVMKKFRLEKSKTKQILRFAKISGLPAAWYIFYNQRDYAALAPPHAELIRIINNFESVALEAILLPHLDYERIFPEEALNFLERYKDILADEEKAPRKDSAKRMTLTCLTILTNKINWSRLCYEDQISAIKALQYDTSLQTRLADAIQHITRQDFLKLVEQGYLMHPTLYGKILLK